MYYLIRIMTASDALGLEDLLVGDVSQLLFHQATRPFRIVFFFSLRFTVRRLLANPRGSVFLLTDTIPAWPRSVKNAIILREASLNI